MLLNLTISLSHCHHRLTQKPLGFKVSPWAQTLGVQSCHFGRIARRQCPGRDGEKEMRGVRAFPSPVSPRSAQHPMAET